jgi:hypothetical protein
VGAAALIPVGAGAVAFLGLLAGWAYFHSGSLALVLPFLGGERLFIEPTAIQLGDQEPGAAAEPVVRIVNSTGKQVRVVGAETSCSCVALDDLPLSIPAGESRELQFKVHVGRRRHEIAETVRLFTDYADRPVFIVTVRGIVR